MEIKRVFKDRWFLFPSHSVELFCKVLPWPRTTFSWLPLHIRGAMWLVQWKVSRRDVCYFLLMWFGGRCIFYTFFLTCQGGVSVQNTLGSHTLEMKEQQRGKSLGALDLHLEEKCLPTRKTHSKLEWISKLLLCLSHCIIFWSLLEQEHFLN